MSKPKTVREFAGGGTVELQSNGIIKITTSRLTRAHVDAFYAAIEEVFSGWRGDSPIYLLVDVSYGPTTSYFRQRAMELYAQARHLPLYTRQAFVADEDSVSHIRKFVKLTGFDNEHTVRVFTSYGDAHQWLIETK